MAKNIVSLICALCVTVGFSGVAPDVFASSTPKRVAAANKKVVKQKFAVKRAKAKSGSVRKPAAVARSADKGFLVSQDGTLQLQSSAVFVQDQASGDVLVDKNSSAVLPIASITKLMTAMVALDATPDLQETLTIGSDDIDLLKGTGSRLNVGRQCVEPAGIGPHGQRRVPVPVNPGIFHDAWRRGSGFRARDAVQ